MTKNIEFRNAAVYIILRFLIVLTIVLSVLRHDYDSVFTCCIALLLFTIPSIVDKKFNVELPTTLESIIYLFIFSSQILGEIRNFYGMFPYWDTMLHTINGFIFAGIGFSICEVLNNSPKTKLFLSPLYITVVAILFSITIGTVWEFFEYGVDRYMYADMQKDRVITDLYTVYFNDTNTVESFNDITQTVIYYGDGEVLVVDGFLDMGLNDTMKDMIVNFIGAIVFAIFGYFYEKGVSTYEFAKNFIPHKKKGY